MDEVDLPPLPTSRPSFTRKRTRQDYEPATSSDPAVFSCDEQAPSAENYASKRRKDMWAGTWWGSKARDAAMSRKRAFKRNYDSGIYMPSSETDSGFEDDLLRDIEKDQETFAQNQRRFQRLAGFSDAALKELPRPVLLSPLQHQVRGIIQTCLEQGKEDVDLSSMSLDSLPPDVSTLKSLTKQSAISAMFSPGSKKAYASIEAHLRLYLANNAFTRIPSPILVLTNLRFLSLRQNDLTEISPGIRSLVNLETLNIAGNRLTYLPCEVLQLVQFYHLKEIIADRNPWMSHPLLADQDIDPELTWPKYPFPRGQTRRLAVSTPEIFQANGTMDRTAQGKLVSSTSVSNSLSPGLAEVALRRISKLQGLANLDDWILESENTPDSVRSMLLTAREVQMSGGRRCTSCAQSFILPRKQWFEWWRLNLESTDGSQVEECLPFLRQQCRIGCESRSVHSEPSTYNLPFRDHGSPR